jgi:hypothetical protein
LKRSFLRRFVAGFSLVALASVIAAAPANAADTQGTGKAAGAAQILGLDAGDLLKLALVGENSVASIDPPDGVPSATETLSPLTVVSNALPALNALTVPSVQTTSTGPKDETSTALVDLASLPQPVPVLSGAINPATLVSLVDVDGAKATLTSTLANVSALGSVLKVDAANLALGGLAAPTSTTSNRGLTIDNVTVLDLRELLNLLGLDLNLLPISTLTALVDQLGLLGTLNSLTGQNFGSAGALLSAINSPTAAAQSAVNTAEAAVATAEQNLNAAVAAAAGLLCNLTPQLPLCQAVTAAQGVLATATATLNSAIAALNAALAQVLNLLNGLADTLDLAPILQVQGLEVGALSTAVATVADSSAAVIAKIGGIKVGGVDLGGLDLNATLDEVQAVAAQVTSTISGVLQTISPSLANVVKIDLLQRATDVHQDGNYVAALAGVTGLVATITPPNVCSVVNDLLGQLPGGLLGNGSLPGVSLPALPVSSLLSTVGSVVSCDLVGGASAGQFQPQALLPNALPALTAPITLTAASVSSAATFQPATTPQTPQTPTTPGLARTGMNETLLLVIGGLMAAVALGLRRAASPVRVRARRR